MPHFTTNVKVVIVNNDGSRVSADLNWQNILLLINQGVTVTQNGVKLDPALAQNQLNALLQQHTFPPTPTPTPIQINPQSVQQSGSFRIENDRLRGRISFITGNNFTLELFGKELQSSIEIFTFDLTTRRKGPPLLRTPKMNRLHFTETERGEIIDFNESAFGENILVIESQVLYIDSQGIFHPVSAQTNYTARALPADDEPPDFEPPPDEPPMKGGIKGQQQITGAIVGLGLLYLIGSGLKKVKKRR